MMIKYKGYNLFEDSIALWAISYSGDIYDGLIFSVNSFKGMFIPEKFSYDPFGSGIYDRKNTPWFDIRKIEEIEQFADPQKKRCFVFGRIKIIDSDEKRRWVEGVRFTGSNLPFKKEGYCNISIQLYAENWVLPSTPLRNHEDFNKHLNLMKQALKGKITDYEGYEGIANENGFNLEKVKEVMKRYGK